MSTNCTKFYIVNGPSRDRLIDSLKYQYEDTEIKLNFGFSPENNNNIDSGIKVRDFKIVSLEFEDGSGYSFNLKGVCDACLKAGIAYSPYRFKAYYDAKCRKGIIEFISGY